MISLKLRSPGGPERVLPVPPGHHSLGGGPADAVRLEGAPAALGDLEVSFDTAIVVARSGCLSLAGRPLKPGERWLLRPGQSLTATAVELQLAVDPAPAPAEGTAAFARCMLGRGSTGPSGSPLPTLVWLNGRDCGKRLPLLDEATFLGRGDGAVARVRDALASRTHAKIAVRQGRAWITHLGSANGLHVDGREVAARCDLYGGEVLRVGETELLFEACLVRPVEPKPAQAVGPASGPESIRAPTRRGVLELALIGAASLAVWLLAR